MDYSAAPPPLHLAPRGFPPPPPPPPPPPRLHGDTTLTLALALPGPPVIARPPSARPRARPAIAATGDTPPCTECGRRFASWKALFGHMRCHPEREWRGITPPPCFRGAADGGTAAAASSATDRFTVEESRAAAILVMMAGDDGKGKKSLHISPCSKEICGTPPAPARCVDHKCSVCDQRFASGKALGGHKRCHRDMASAEAVVFATSGGRRRLATSETPATAMATSLDLNLPPPGAPLPRKSDQGEGWNAMLDLKLGR